MQDRKHVQEDLSPYTCIFSTCAKPETLFRTKELWRQHLFEEHTSSEYWICFACGDGTHFLNMDSFKSHTKTEHGASIAIEQIPLLADVCKRSALLDIRSCPFCDSFQCEGGEVDKEMLFDHIATEIHSFSLLALPWADDDGRETNECMKHSTEKVYDWLVDNQLSENPDKERPPYEKKVYIYEHFEQNPYFADSSGSSGGSEAPSLTSVEQELEKMKQQDDSSLVRDRDSDASLSEEITIGDEPDSPVGSREATITDISSEDETISTGDRAIDCKQTLKHILARMKTGDPDKPMCKLLLKEIREFDDYWTWDDICRITTAVGIAARHDLGKDDQDTFVSLNNLAVLLFSEGRRHGGLQLCGWVLESQSEILGRDHPSTLTTMADLSILYGYLKRWGEAREKSREVAERRIKVLGSDHADTLSSLEYLASIVARYGNWDGAAEILQQVTERNSSPFSMVDLAIIRRRLAATPKQWTEQVETSQTGREAIEGPTRSSDAQQGQDNVSVGGAVEGTKKMEEEKEEKEDLSREIRDTTTETDEIIKIKNDLDKIYPQVPLEKGYPNTGVDQNTKRSKESEE